MLSHLFTNWKLKLASWPFVGPTNQKTPQPQIIFVLEKDKNIEKLSNRKIEKKIENYYYKN